MIIELDRTGTVVGLKKAIAHIMEHDHVYSILILACDKNDFEANTIDPILHEISHPVIGGVFPEIMYGREKLDKGTIVAGLPVKPDIHIVPDLSNPAADYGVIMDEKINVQTMMVFVDGLASRISDLIDSLFYVFGLETNYIGGGAGSLSFVQRPCLMTNQGLLQDCAVLALFDSRSGIGVSHGWQDLQGPFKVTEVEQNVIKTLDWRPAFEVYREAVETASGEVFTADNFFDLAKGYPFGINKFDSEKIVRDPIVLEDDGSLVCVGEVPEESYVSILQGSVPSLVEAANKALTLAEENIENLADQHTALFIDCISRVLFLEENFAQELEAVYDVKTDLIGALTLGEIANSGRDYLEFYNKTAVVGILEM